MNTPAERRTLEQFAEPAVAVPARTFARMLDSILDGAAKSDAPMATPARLRQLQAQDRTPIGERGLYGIYAGIARGAAAGQDRGPAGDYILEVLDEAPKAMTWKDALAWAKSIGGELPSRKEQALMFANVPELFQPEYYWSGEQYASAAGYAWNQNFNDGYQNYWRTTTELRARAVRRLSIE